MKKNTILYILLIFLIAVNGFFIFNYIGKKPNRERFKTPDDIIANTLNFNTNQLKEFKSKSRNHHQKMRKISDEIRDLKGYFFDNISKTSINDSEIDSIATLIGAKVKAKDLEVFYYFRAVEAICTDAQKRKFKNIIKDALHNGHNKPMPPPPPPPRRTNR